MTPEIQIDTSNTSAQATDDTETSSKFFVASFYAIVVSIWDSQVSKLKKLIRINQGRTPTVGVLKCHQFQNRILKRSAIFKSPYEFFGNYQTLQNNFYNPLP